MGGSRSRSLWREGCTWGSRMVHAFSTPLLRDTPGCGMVASSGLAATSMGTMVPAALLTAGLRGAVGVMCRAGRRRSKVALGQECAQAATANTFRGDLFRCRVLSLMATVQEPIA